MRIEDIIDLKAFLDTLPAVADVNRPHKLPFPYNIRRGLGLWKLLYVDGKTFTPDPAASDKVNRGAYLVEGPGHCGQCHTPRNLIGGPVTGRALVGGPAPEGKGNIRNITPDKTGIGDWSEANIVTLLKIGFKPDFDAVGGPMAAVVQNTALLPKTDLEAIRAREFEPENATIARIRAAYALASEEILHGFDKLNELFFAFGALTPMGLNFLGFEESGHIVPPGQSLRCVAQPQEEFKPLRLVVESECARHFDLVEIRIGNNSQFLSVAKIPCSLFTRENHIFGTLNIDMARIAQTIQITVTNKSTEPYPFEAALFGLTAPKY